MSNTYIWLALFLGFAIFELCTISLTSMWFAVGAFFAFIASLFTDNLIIQLVVFLVVSIAFLILLRPLLQKKVNSKIEKTNVAALEGKSAVVTIPIDNVAGKGQIAVEGSIWSARSESGDMLEEGAKVVIVGIEGVKAVVKPEE